MGPVMRALVSVALGIVLLGSVGCSADEDGTSTSTAVPPPAGTADATAADDFAAEAQAVCADVDAELRAAGAGDASTASGTSTASATVLRSLVEVNREGVDRLRAIEAPAELRDRVDAWLDLVDATANDLEAGANALQAGDRSAFGSALADAEETSRRAARAARELELPICAFGT